jgi:hypothetical protein
MTDNQLAALYSLRDGQWRYGISINGRHSLTSLHKRGLVSLNRKSTGSSAIEWQITPEGLKILEELSSKLEKTG